ncbi:hypothetical protein D3C86_1960430 [compost metagenome]
MPGEYRFPFGFSVSEITRFHPRIGSRPDWFRIPVAPIFRICSSAWARLAAVTGGAGRAFTMAGTGFHSPRASTSFNARSQRAFIVAYEQC